MKDHKKNVLMVHNYYQVGGGEHTVFQNETEMLKRHGHEVTEYTRSNDELKHSFLKVLLLPFSTIWSIKTYREVKKLIKEENIDIVHCHNTFPLISPSVYYAARKMHVPVVQTIHNFRFLCPNGIFYCDGHICERCKEKNNFIPALKKRCYRDSFCETLIVVMMLRIHRMIGTYKKISYIFLTEYNKDKFKTITDKKESQIFIKPNFVENCSFEEKKRNLSIKTFVFVGRLDRTKGIDFLVDNWNRMPKDYELLIFGDGPLRTYVTEIANHYTNLKFYGFQKKEKILESLKQATALVFPSRLYEGFPMVIAESFSVGTPIITSNIGNQANIVDVSGGGVKFICDNTDSFINATNLLIQNEEQFSKTALFYYKMYLMEEKNYSLMMDIYGKVKCI